MYSVAGILKELWHMYSNIWTITLAQIHIVTVLLSIFRAYVKLEVGPNLADQRFREQELDHAKQLFNRTWSWCGHASLRGTAELICKRYAVLWGIKATDIWYIYIYHYHNGYMLYKSSCVCVCEAIPCWGCELPLWPRKCMANCWMGPVRPSSPGTEGGMMKGPEGPPSGVFTREPRVSSTLSTSSPQCRVNSFMSICTEQERM